MYFLDLTWKELHQSIITSRVLWQTCLKKPWEYVTWVWTKESVSFRNLALSQKVWHLWELILKVPTKCKQKKWGLGLEKGFHSVWDLTLGGGWFARPSSMCKYEVSWLFIFRRWRSKAVGWVGCSAPEVCMNHKRTLDSIYLSPSFVHFSCFKPSQVSF